GALDVDAVLETVVRLAVELSGAEAGLLSLTSRDGERIEQAHSHNMAPAPDNHQPPKGQGLAWEVILTRRPLLLDDYHQHPRRMGTLERAALRAYLGVPLLTGEQCLGALAVACTAPERRFTPRDLETLQTVASQAGIAIQNARLYRELSEELAERRRMEDALQQRDVILEAVAFAAGQFLRSQDWQGYIQTVLAELGQITNSSHAYIFQNHPGPDGRTVTSQLYQWTRPGDQPTLAMAEFLNVPLEGPGLERWRQAMLDGEPFYGSRSTFLPGEERFLAPLGAQSILEMPIYLRAEFRRPAPEADMEWWGMIGFDDYTAERRWSAAEVDAIRIAASIFSAAIQRQRADEAMRQREDIYRRAISSADAVPYLQEYSPNRFVFMGEGITHLLGYTAAEVTPQLWKTHVDQANMLGSAAHLSEPQAYELARAGQLPNWRCDYLMRTRSGEQRWIADSGVELIGPDGLSYGCIGILQDVTDRKRVEQAAQQANQELERRVQERTSALETANREMESFAYSVSHDLRAPLRAIDGYSSILMQDHLSGLDEDAQACLDNIRQATLKMNQLIDDLLQLSRVTRAEMQTVAVDLSELAAEWKRVRQAQEPERTVRLAIQPGLQAAGDPNLLRIALGNLLDNAWKFTRRSSEPRIEIGCQDQPGPDGLQCTVYFVRDNGAGFDMRYAGRLFQAFQRLHNPSEFEGTGVGLATVQRVVRRHHGQVWAEGQVDGGATFYFTLGKAPAEPPA
ncbi:MAG: GAF domain-containing protein, partial [Chloroflexota bacterium]